ncbi:MAG: DUF4429 domain-containing protein [Propionibacteriaceae bacterium]|jgi:hypothetical protein|nr:DUF4429 domain-containing protein [Propionibacteriaceae bacterium]
MEIISATGQTGRVSFDGHFVTISRTGYVAVLNFGKSEKRIPITAISAVQFRPAGSILRGFIQFTLAGAIEQRSQFMHQIGDATEDENSVVFLKKSSADMEAVRDAIEQAIIKLHEPHAPQPQAASPSTSEELNRLAQLHAQGVLSDSEFSAAKNRILGL